MLKGISLQALAAKIEDQQKRKRDFIVDTAAVRMEVQSGKPALVIPEHGQLQVLPLAHNQIAGRTGIPVKYYDRMREEAPDLLASNVNKWFAAKPERRMVRAFDTDARAFLSNRYQRIDYAQTAEVVLPVLMDLPEVQITSCEVTDRRLYIHFVVPTVQGEVKVGDIVQAGGIVSNSEVGLGAVSVSGLTWRLWCLNGAKTADTFRRNHVGRAVEDDGELDWADDTRKADDAAVLFKVRDMVRAVVDETRFKSHLAKLQGLATEGRITGDPAKAVELLAQKVGASEEERGSILRKLSEGGDLSRWGVVNAVTALAHTAKSYDRAVEIEAIGGQLIDLPATEWKHVLEAA